MVELDAEVYLACIITMCIGVGATVALVAVLAWRVRQVTFPNSVPFHSWSRFQTLSICSCTGAIVFQVTSIIELILVMNISPENLTKSPAAIPGVWNKGVQKFLVSLTESIGQVSLATTVYLYFLILMERLAAFRFLLSARLFQIIYTPIFILGTLLFLLMLLPTFLINTVSLSDPAIEFLVVGSATLIFLSSIIELALSIALCRTFFVRTWGHRHQDSWSLGHRLPNGGFSNTESQQKPNTASIRSSRSNAPTFLPNSVFNSQSHQTTDTSASNLSESHFSDRPSNHSNTLIVARPSGLTIHSRSDALSTRSLTTVLRDTYQRRTLLLFVAIVLADAAGVLFYSLSIMPEAQSMSRPLEIIGRSTIAFHIMLALIFLESFKQILHPNYFSGSDLSTAVLTVL